MTVYLMNDKNDAYFYDRLFFLRRRSRLLFFRLHRRKEDDVADRRAVRKKHDETIEPHAQTTCGRQAVFERVDEIFVDLRVVVALCALCFYLLDHTLLLVNRVV